MNVRQALFLTCAGMLTVASAAHAQNAALIADVKASRVLMIEEATGTVLLSRKPDEAFAPGSLSKLMTVELVLHALEEGEVSAEKALPVSEFAWRTGGAPSRTTTMFAALRSSIPVVDLLNGVIVQNANDGCIILAEGLSGSEEAFTERLNERARQLGLTGSVFSNATGLPPAESHVTARDMIALARHMKTAYPDYFPLYAKPDFEWNKIRQRNKNPALGIAGVEGFAGGFAEGAGFSLVTTAARGETRLYLVMSGLASEKDRLDEAQRLIDWGFNDFKAMRVYSAGDIAGQASVYGGAGKTVALAPLSNVNVYAPIAESGRLSAQIIYRGPLKAPLAKGTEVGRLKVTIGDAILQDVPIYTAEGMEQGTLTSRAIDALKALLFFWL